MAKLATVEIYLVLKSLLHALLELPTLHSVKIDTCVYNTSLSF